MTLDKSQVEDRSKQVDKLQEFSAICLVIMDRIIAHSAYNEIESVHPFMMRLYFVLIYKMVVHWVY
jgi:hypothetical protein